jgi:transposase InsO family protein
VGPDLAARRISGSGRADEEPEEAGVVRELRLMGCEALCPLATHLRAELACDALRMAIATRGGDVAGVILHSDRGCQYTAAVPCAR